MTTIETIEVGLIPVTVEYSVTGGSDTGYQNTNHDATTELDRPQIDIIRTDPSESELNQAGVTYREILEKLEEKH